MATRQRTISQRRSCGSKTTADISNETSVEVTFDEDREVTVKNVKITEKKLGGKVLGWAYYDEPRIEIDSRLRHKLQQEVLLHELLHIALPDLD